MTLDQMMRSAQWERVKGELRAAVAIQGSYPAGLAGSSERWAAFHKKVEEFIEEVEDHGLHE